MKEKKIDVFCEKFSEKWQRFTEKLYNGFGSFENTLSQKNSFNIIIIAIVCIATFAMMFYMNINTPFAIDDYYYNFIYAEDGEESFEVTDERVSNISDIVTSMKAHYHTMNGRLVTHSVLQLMMIAGKPAFNVINSIMCVFLFLLMYKHCRGKTRKKNSALLFIAIALAWWCFTPVVYRDSVWMDGSVNYLWASVFRLSVLLPFRLYAEDGIEKHTIWKIPIMFVLGTLSGGTNENSGGAFIFICILFMIYYRIKKYKVPIWSFVCTIGSIMGFIFMISAPGNSIRIEEQSEDKVLPSLPSRMVHTTVWAFMSVAFFIAVFIVLSLILYKYGKKDKKYKIGISFIFGLTALANGLAMVLSPVAPDRTLFSSSTCAIISVGILFYQLNIAPSIYKKIIIICIAIWMPWCAYEYLHVAKDANALMDKIEAREEYIEEQKALGNYDLKVEMIKPLDSRSPLYTFRDVMEDPEEWPNVGMAKYYGLNSIVGYEAEEKDNK